MSLEKEKKQISNQLKRKREEADYILTTEHETRSNYIKAEPLEEFEVHENKINLQNLNSVIVEPWDCLSLKYEVKEEEEYTDTLQVVLEDTETKQIKNETTPQDVSDDKTSLDHSKDHHDKPKQKLLRGYVCTKCQKDFKNYKILKAHMKIHNIKKKPVKPHTCYICHTLLSSKGAVKEHIKRQHAEKKSGIYADTFTRLKNMPDINKDDIIQMIESVHLTANQVFTILSFFDKIITKNLRDSIVLKKRNQNTVPDPSKGGLEDKEEASDENETMSNYIKAETLEQFDFHENKRNLPNFNSEIVEPLDFVCIKYEVKEEEEDYKDPLQVFQEDTETKTIKTETTNQDVPKDKTTCDDSKDLLSPMERKKLKVHQFMRYLVANPLDSETQPPPEEKPTHSLAEIVSIVEGGSTCPSCDLEFASPDRLVDHMFNQHLISDRHPSERVQCPLPGCGLGFPCPTVMRAHYNKKHKPKQMILSVTRCRREGCRVEDRVMGLFCSKDHSVP